MKSEASQVKKVVLLSCASQKLHLRAIARELYISPLFKFSLRYAESLRPNSIFILSAKYGLLDLETWVEPYDLTLNALTPREIRDWADRVLAQLDEQANLQKDLFIFLAGVRYRKLLLSHIKSYEIPMQGLSIGRQLQFLKKHL